MITIEGKIVVFIALIVFTILWFTLLENIAGDTPAKTRVADSSLTRAGQKNSTTRMSRDKTAKTGGQLVVNRKPAPPPPVPPRQGLKWGIYDL